MEQVAGVILTLDSWIHPAPAHQHHGLGITMRKACLEEGNFYSATDDPNQAELLAIALKSLR